MTHSQNVLVVPGTADSGGKRVFLSLRKVVGYYIEGYSVVCLRRVW